MSGTDALYVLLVWDMVTDQKHVYTSHVKEEHENRKSLFESSRHMAGENIYTLDEAAKKVVRNLP